VAILIILPRNVTAVIITTAAGQRVIKFLFCEKNMHTNDF
jgi:hypothetical protein